MKYYSTNGRAPKVDLWQAIGRGVAPDGGLYMPERLPYIPAAFFNNLGDLKLGEIGYVVGNTLFGDEIDSRTLKDIVCQSLNFEIPLRQIEDNIFALELYGGPSLSVKDTSVRIMAKFVEYYIANGKLEGMVNVIAATSGDTGAAVAKAFADVKEVNAYILYPEGQLSKFQEHQLSSAGSNIFPVAVSGSYDQCRELAHQALSDKDINDRMTLISANSINIARLMPQMLFYYWAYSLLLNRLGHKRVDHNLVFSVPCGNLGNVCAGIIAEKMGLPSKRIIAANNDRDSFMKFHSGQAEISKQIEKANDAASIHLPSNMSRLLNLLDNDIDSVKEMLLSSSWSDTEVWEAISDINNRCGCVVDPHGATCYLSLKRSLAPDEVGVFLVPTNPVKYREDIKNHSGIDIPLQALDEQVGKPTHMPPTLSALRRVLFK